MSTEDITTNFLSPNGRMRRLRPPPAGPVTVKPPVASREAEMLRQRQRDLGTYGEQLIERIYKDYEIQIEAWKSAFGEIVAAFAGAIGGRDRTLKDAERERARDAAFEAVIFSLLLAGSMRFLGAYVQYSLVPRIKINQSPKVQWHDSLPGVGVLIPVAPYQFSSLMASAFGGIAQDLGNRLIPLAFTAPPVPSQPIDTWDGVWTLQTDLNNLISQSRQIVLRQFKDVQAWMTDKTEFGEDWLKYTGDDMERARKHIYNHIESLRYQWAKDWEFFGKTPNPIHRKLLADQYERSLWAGHLLAALKEAEKLVAANKSGGRYTGDYLVKKAIENAIVNKLKELNVVLAETSGGTRDQKQRVTEGSPNAEVEIDGSVDRYREVLRLRSWAETYLKDVRPKTELEFFPPARERTLARL